MKVIKDIVVADVFKYIAEGVVTEGSKLIVTDNAGFESIYYADSDLEFILDDEIVEYLNDCLTVHKLRWKAELHVSSQYYLRMPNSQYYICQNIAGGSELCFDKKYDAEISGFKFIFTDKEINESVDLRKYKGIFIKEVAY